MKLLKLLLCFSIIALTFSCEDDDNNTQDNLFGTWNLASVEFQNTITPATGCELSNTFTFEADSSGNNVFPENEPNEPCDYETITFLWSRNADILTLDTNGEGVILVELIALTSTQLQVSVFENDGVAVPEAERRIFTYNK